MYSEYSKYRQRAVLLDAEHKEAHFKGQRGACRYNTGKLNKKRNVM